MNFIHEAIELPTLTRETTDKGRLYTTPDGKKYPSVTTVLGAIKNDGIEQWKKRVGETEANRISKIATDKGTAVHDLLEQYLKNNPAPKSNPMIEYSANQLKPILDKHITKVLCQEVFLYSDKLRTAGQVDVIGYWDDVLSVIDFKTSRKLKQESWIKGYFMQESFYGYAFEERTGMKPKQIITLIATDDGEPQIFIKDAKEYLNDFIKVRMEFLRQRGH